MCTDLEDEVKVGDNSAARRYPLHQQHIGCSTIGRVPAGVSNTPGQTPHCLTMLKPICARQEPSKISLNFELMCALRIEHKTDL